MNDIELETEIGALAGLDLFALRERWKGRHGTDAPVRMSRELMLRSLAYRMQEQVFGGLSRAAKSRLLSPVPIRNVKAVPARKNRSIKPGTKFIREWNGRTHEVIGMADGRYLYNGNAYRSLSVIAREITGTRWSGPTFFGLNAKGKGRDVQG